MKNLSNFTIALLVVLSAVCTLSATAQDLTIGILAPTAGPNQSLGEQVKAGAQFGVKSVEETFNFDFDLNWLDNWDGSDVEDGLNQIAKFDADVVIVDLDTQGVTKFFELASRQELKPALLLSNGRSRLDIGTDFVGQTPILQLGEPDDALFVASLKKWALDHPNLESVIVIYDKRYKSTLKYGEELVQKTLGSLPGRNFEVIKSSFSSDRKPYYEDQVTNAIKKKPDGIVLVAKSVDRANFTVGLRKHEVTYNSPMFLSGPINFSAIDFVAANGGASVYYGDVYGNIFWDEKPDDLVTLEQSSQMTNFAKEVNNELGWSQYAFSSAAVDAYNAIQILAKVVEERSYQASNNASWQDDNPWKIAKNKSIVGLTGNLYYSQSLHSMIAPSHLVVVENKTLDVLETELDEK